MPVVTISRGVGCLGDEIGRRVAERLGLPGLDKAIFTQVAEKANASAPDIEAVYERRAGLVDRLQLMSGFQLYLSLVEREMRRLADEGGAVLLGRAAHVVLRDRDDVYSVRVVAPMADRVARIRASDEITERDARQYIAAEDRRRSRYHKYLYDVEWDDATLYHTVINTGRVDVEWAVNHIVWAAQNLPRPPAD